MRLSVPQNGINSHQSLRLWFYDSGIAVWPVWVHFRDIALIYKWSLREGFPTVESFVSSHSKCEADLGVAYGKLVTMGLCRVEVWTHLLFLVTICFVAITKKFFVWSSKRSTYSENRDDQSMRQVVPYRKLKTMERWKTVTPKSGRGRLTL